MSQYRSVFLLFITISLLFGAGCFKGGSSDIADPDTSAVQNIPFGSVDTYIPSDQIPDQTPDSVALPPVAAEVKAGEKASVGGNIIVSSLVEKQKLANPFVILGRGRAFENVINWRIRDLRNAVLAEGNIMTNAKEVGEYGAFRVRAFFDTVPETPEGYVDVYTISPRDGSEQDMVTIPVSFEMNKSTVEVYFSNIEQDPDASYCERTYPVIRRIVKTQNIAEAALRELLKGPTTQEQVSGSRTSILPGTVLRSISITDGVATADFSRELVFALAGSCNVQALVSQVTETLLQFDTIDSVRIFVEGEDAELELQP